VQESTAAAQAASQLLKDYRQGEKAAELRKRGEALRYKSNNHSEILRCAQDDSVKQKKPPGTGEVAAEGV